MSGGSWDYLFLADLTPRRAEVGAMAERLRELGHENVAHATARVVTHLQMAERMRDELESVWRAVEYLDSADYGEDQVAEIVAEWARENAHRQVNL